MSSSGGSLGGDSNKMAWLHEHLTRDKSEATLRGLAMGTFLLRTSSSPGDYSVSVNAGAHIEHFKVSYDTAARNYLFGQRRFDSLPALVAFYKGNAIYTLANGTNIFLLTPYTAGK